MKEPMVSDGKQKQVGETFSSLWGDTGPYAGNEAALEISRAKFQDWSDDRISDWVEMALGNSNGKPHVIDFGCGLGFSAVSLFETHADQIAYCGVDLFSLKKTEQFLAAKGFTDVTLTNKNVVSDALPEGFDLAIAMGSLHHTTSVEASLKNTRTSLKEGGRFIGWIINEQKRLRKVTDASLREFYMTLGSDEEKWEESRKHAQLAWEISNALGDAEITLEDDVPSWELERGTYKIQTLLFDYLIKISKDDSLERSAHQAYDWFVPEYYHQTSREDLLAMLEAMNVYDIEIITKTNGHMFSFVT